MKVVKKRVFITISLVVVDNIAGRYKKPGSAGIIPAL